MVNEPGGQPQLVLVGLRDITELLHLQAEMRRSEMRYRRLFEAARDGVLIIDPATRKILDANPFMTELFGYTREEMVGKEPFEIGLLKDEAAGRAMFQELQKKSSIRDNDLPLHTKTGKLHYVEMISHLYQEGEEKVIQCKIRDVTQRKQAEEALRLAQAQLSDRAGQLEQAVAERTTELTTTNQQLEGIVYCIAHDLRAPLRSMQGFSRMLVEEVVGVALSETGRDFANRISTAAQLMDALLADLLAFSEISQHRIELSPVNLETAVRSALARVEKEIQEKNALVEDLGEWPTVLAHEPTLRQVLFNLVSNALKFVRADSPHLVRLWAEEAGAGFQHAGSPGIPAPSAGQHAAPTDKQNARDVCPTGFVRVYVEDNGVGIAPEHQAQIFRLFSRLHGERHPGTGIGLAIVQQGVERMRGRVGVDSTPGQGSRFWFELRKA
jgi:PAS domain S-box-containing protein